MARRTSTTNVRRPLVFAVASTAALTAFLLPLGFTASNPHPAAADRFHEGLLEVYHADFFADGISRDSFFLDLASSDRLEVRFGSDPPVLGSGNVVRIAGERAGDVLHVASGRDVEILRHAPGPHSHSHADATGSLDAASGVLVEKKTALILINFLNDASQPVAPATAKTRVFGDAPEDSARSFYQESSYGQWKIVGKVAPSGDVFGWYTINDSNSPCDYSNWASLARGAAVADGHDMTGYDQVIYSFPGASACGWGGLGEINGDDSWINGAPTTRVVSHELGHNYGLHHANDIACTLGGARISFSSTCSDTEYGDPWDVMGTNPYQLGAFNRGRMGLLAASNTYTVSGTSGTYVVDIAPLHLTTTAVQTVRVAKGTEYFYVEYHQTNGRYDNFLPLESAVTGVMIRRAPGYGTVSHTYLYDTRPESDTQTDATLDAGRIFSDGAGIAIKVLSLSTTNARIEVALGADVTPPASPTLLRVVPLSATRMQLAWNESPNGAEVEQYIVYRKTGAGPFAEIGRIPARLGVTGFGATLWGLSEGALPLRGFVDPSGATPASQYQVRAMDPTGNLSPASNTACATQDCA